LLEQNEWERDSLLSGNNGADGITWTITRVVRPTHTPFVGAYVHKDQQLRFHHRCRRLHVLEFVWRTGDHHRLDTDLLSPGEDPPAVRSASAYNGHSIRF
jgi:hypothetical protein